MILTAFFALYLSRKLQRSDDSDKVERDLLIGYFNTYQNDFCNDIHKLTSQDGVLGTDVSGTLKNLSMSLQELLDLARSHSSGNHESGNEKLFVEIENVVSSVRTLLSDAPLQGEVEDGVRVENGKFFYSTKHLSEITQRLGQFRKSIFLAIVGINRFAND